MPKYEVTVKEIEIYYFEVIEADNESEAREKACELMDSKEIRDAHHNDSEGEVEALEL